MDDRELTREQRLIALEERLTRLERVSDQNAQVFSDSLQFAELCIQALQRALDDVAGGTLKTLDVDLPPPAEVVEINGETVLRGTLGPVRRAVDFKAYLNDALQQRLSSEAPAAPPSGDTQLVFEFGGG